MAVRLAGGRARLEAFVAGQEMERQPALRADVVAGVLEIERRMRGRLAVEAHAVVEADESRRGRVVDVLRRIGDDLGLVVAETGQSRDRVGGAEVKVDLHDASLSSRADGDAAVAAARPAPA